MWIGEVQNEALLSTTNVIVKDEGMTTISSNSTFTGMSAVTPGSRRVSFDSANSGGVQIKRVELTAEQKADLEQRKAVAAAVEAASEKQRLEIEKKQACRKSRNILVKYF